MSRAGQSRLDTSYARLREHLAYLGLATAAEQLAPELERARGESAAPVEVLERLLAAEVRIPPKAIIQFGVFDHPWSEAAKRPTLGQLPPDDHLLSKGLRIV
ncbi:MAG: hypothetical protein IT305_05630 [Chloroflexi bacterium]|nr:hypothetical protein [Chloroflexota bacterium]